MHMDNMHDEFWTNVLPDVREALGLRPLSIMESELAYRDAPVVELREDEIDGLMAQAMSDIPKELDHDTPTTDISDAMREEFLQLNREQGDEDAEVDDSIQRQRDEVLDEDADEEDDEPEVD